METSGGSSKTYYVHTDHLTGSNAITDEDGYVVQVLDYYPFGDIRLNDNYASFDEKRKFTGHEHDDETDLEYMLARYYNGNVGRFISRDTFEGSLDDPQSLNKYSYTRNNPLIYIDPTGNSNTLSSALSWGWGPLSATGLKGLLTSAGVTISGATVVGVSVVGIIGSILPFGAIEGVDDTTELTPAEKEAISGPKPGEPSNNNDNKKSSDSKMIARKIVTQIRVIHQIQNLV